MGCYPDRHLKYTPWMYKTFLVAYQVSVLPQTTVFANFNTTLQVERLKMSDGPVRLQLRTKA